VTINSLIKLLTTLKQRYPDAILEKNLVGNLAVIVNDRYAGYIDIHEGVLATFEDFDED